MSEREAVTSVPSSEGSAGDAPKASIAVMLSLASNLQSGEIALTYRSLVIFCNPDFFIS